MRIIKAFVFIAGICILIPAWGQSSPIDNYLNTVNGFAAIYSGELEHYYSSVLYDNQPYYKTNEYQSGNLWTKDNSYPNMQIRLDLYREQIITLVPQFSYGAIIDSREIEKLTLADETFIFLHADNKHDLKKGFYKLLYQGEKISALEKETAILVTPQDKPTRHFIRSKRYYLVKDDIAYTLRNKRSLTKIFPEYKKQINKYIKDNRLDWKNNTVYTITQLVIFCDKLTNENP